uniref:carbamoyl-phosphate synthase large subunit n=1 Tax=Thomasclavelia sp. TaxID=3025757 RepID=UPI0025F990FC
LASKATGYPIAKLAAKIALGYTLDEIINAVTGKTYASYEPTLDYIVCKIPKWPFDKFVDASRELGTQMKATGEVMSICNNFEGALMKALRSLEQNVYYLQLDELADKDEEFLMKQLEVVDDHRIFVIAEALRKGISEQIIHNITKIDLWFIDKIKHLIEVEQQLCNQELTVDLLKLAKRLEFPNRVIAKLTNKPVELIKQMCKDNDIKAVYKIVDTCAAEFDATTPYYYSVYGGVNEVDPTDNKKKIMVLGSGPIRIGQGIEFDYCSVHCVWALKEAGYDTIIVNNNPETVSTDFDIADRLYFEPLTPEDVENIVDIEKPDGAIVQFGGQTAIKLTKALMEMGVKILGTSADDVDAAEDRERFDEILEKCEIDRPRGSTVFTVDEALEVANRLKYPVLVRPSYVLGGAGMEICLNDGDVKKFMEIINRQYQEHPILIDKYLSGKEVEVDAICDEHGVLIPGIMEHVERAGVHSGDSISVYPSQKIKAHIKDTIVEYTKRLAKALNVIGLINIQFIVYEDQVYVIEVNPRSSRTIPYISKVTDIPVVDVATHVIMGKSIKEQGYDYGLAPEKQTVAVKMPVFSFEKIKGAEISLGPEMKSTGEVLGISTDYDEAIYKAFIGSGINLPKKKNIICTIKDSAKEEFLPIARQYYMFGYDLYATEGTYNFLKENNVPVNFVNRIDANTNTIFDLMLSDTVDLVIDIPTRNNNLKDGFLIRRFAVEAGIPIFTSLDTAQALITSLEKRHKGDTSLIDITKLK